MGLRGMSIGIFGETIYKQCFEFFDFLEKSFLDKNDYSDRKVLAKMHLIRRKYKTYGGKPSKQS